MNEDTQLPIPYLPQQTMGPPAPSPPPVAQAPMQAPAAQPSMAMPSMETYLPMIGQAAQGAAGKDVLEKQIEAKTKLAAAQEQSKSTGMMTMFSLMAANNAATHQANVQKQYAFDEMATSRYGHFAGRETQGANDGAQQATMQAVKMGMAFGQSRAEANAAQVEHDAWTDPATSAALVKAQTGKYLMDIAPTVLSHQFSAQQANTQHGWSMDAESRRLQNEKDLITFKGQQPLTPEQQATIGYQNANTKYLEARTQNVGAKTDNSAIPQTPADYATLTKVNETLEKSLEDIVSGSSYKPGARSLAKDVPDTPGKIWGTNPGKPGDPAMKKKVQEVEAQIAANKAIIAQSPYAPKGTGTSLASSPAASDSSTPIANVSLTPAAQAAPSAPQGKPAPADAIAEARSEGLDDAGIVQAMTKMYPELTPAQINTFVQRR